MNPFVITRVSSGLSRIAARRAHERQTLERASSAQSRRGLDWVNFFIADVQEGFGAFIAFYLANLSWSQSSVGLMLTIGRITSAVVLIPGGALTDAIRWKRALLASGLITIAAAALIFALHPTYLFVIVAEILHGATAGLITPALAAISLGLVGRRAIPGHGRLGCGRRARHLVPV